MEKYPPSHPMYVELPPHYGQQRIYVEDIDRYVMANFKIEILEYPHESALYSLEEEKEAIQIFKDNGYYPMHFKDMVAINVEWWESLDKQRVKNA